MSNNHSKMSNKLVSSYTFFFAVILSVIIMIFYLYILHTGKQIAMLNQKELADQAIKSVESYLTDLDNKSYQVMTDSRIINMFSKINSYKSNENYFDGDILSSIDMGSILASIIGPSEPVWRISVYNEQGDYISAGAVVNQKSVKETLSSANIAEEMIYLLYKTDKIQITHPQKDKWSDVSGSDFVSIKRPLMNIYSKEVLGIVEIQNDITSLSENLNFQKSGNVIVKVYDESGNQILPINSTELQKSHSSAAVSKKYGWQVEIIQSEKDLLSPYKPIILMLGIYSVILFIIVIIIIFLIARRLSKPLVLLSKTVSKININSIPDTLPINDKINEISELKESFKNMISRINDSISHERRAWLLALQSQMNPHFLFNMLSVISAAAIENGNYKIADMCSKMSSMFRYVANYEEITVTIQSELDHVYNYLELMKERYEDYFNFDIIADDNIKQMLIPKLVLQPLAENCFMHGFKNIEPPYYVRIEAIIDGSYGVIRISDNGSGITPEKKIEIMKKIDQYQTNLPKNYSNMKIGGMGLISTILRFKLYSAKYIDYSIEDNVPNGTIINIRSEI